MTPLISMRDALASPDYFGTYLADPSWAAWKVLLISIMGEELTAEERVVFERLTGRPTEPTQAVRAFWAVIGRRGGKSLAFLREANGSPINSVTASRLFGRTRL